jgi:hypothetical protein
MASISLWLREVVSLSLPCPSFKSQPTTDVALEKVSATRRKTTTAVWAESPSILRKTPAEEEERGGGVEKASSIS